MTARLETCSAQKIMHTAQKNTHTQREEASRPPLVIRGPIGNPGPLPALIPSFPNYVAPSIHCRWDQLLQPGLNALVQPVVNPAVKMALRVALIRIGQIHE